MEYFYISKNEFNAFSLEHLGVIIFFVVLATLIYSIANNFLSTRGRNNLGLILACIPAITVLIRMYVEYRMGEFSYLEDLPLFICRLVSFMLPILFWNKSKMLFGVLYFWVMAGTTNALITPDILFGLPHFESLFYWIIHTMLVIVILYGVFVYKWRPQKKDIFRAFVWANIYLAMVFLVNLLLGTNYSYTMHKPINGSILDYFGPWPWYLLTGQLLALILFVLFYIPFAYKEKDNN